MLKLAHNINIIIIQKLPPYFPLFYSKVFSELFGFPQISYNCVSFQLSNFNVHINS